MTNGHTAAVEEPSEAQRKQTGEGRAAPPGREESMESMFQLGLKRFVRTSQMPVGKGTETKSRKLEVWGRSVCDQWSCVAAS